MAELKIYLPNDLNSRFRKIAMSVFGYGRGSLSKAAQEALENWCAGHDDEVGPTSRKVDSLSREVTPLRVNPDERQQESDLPTKVTATESSDSRTTVCT